MITATCEITGISNYVFSKPTQDTTPKSDADSIKVAKNRVYKNEKSKKLFIPNSQIKATIFAACVLNRIKIEKSMQVAKALIKSTLKVYPEEIYFKPDLKMSDIIIMKYPLVLKSGPLIWTHAAYIEPGWKLSFTIAFSEIFGEGLMKELLETAGILCGIGGMRGQENGRSEVSKFEV